MHMCILINSPYKSGDHKNCKKKDDNERRHFGLKFKSQNFKLSHIQTHKHKCLKAE